MKTQIKRKHFFKIFICLSLYGFFSLKLSASYAAISSRPVRTCKQTVQGLSQTKEKTKLLEKILTVSGELKEEFIGQEGLVLFTKTHFRGQDLNYIFQTAQDTLPKPLFKRLEWKQFYGSVKTWNELSKIIKNSQRIFIQNFKDIEGYVFWAERYFNEDMEKAFLSAEAICPPELFNQLNWDIFYGSKNKLMEFINFTFSVEGKVLDSLKGMSGYTLFSLRMTGGDMHKAYMNTKAILNENLMNQLGWRYFDGKESGFQFLKNYIYHSKGLENFIRQFKSTEGLVSFAENISFNLQARGGENRKRIFPYRGQVEKAFNNVSAVLGNNFHQLEWDKAFVDRGSYLRSILERVLFQVGGAIREEFIEEFKGRDGYLRFSDKYFEGDMYSAFQYIKSQTRNHFIKFRWKQFGGMTKDFKNLRDKILNKNGKVKKGFSGSDGLRLFADLNFSSDRQKAFDAISTVLDNLIFTPLKWKSPKDFNSSRQGNLNRILFDNEGQIQSQWIETEGYLRLAEEHYPDLNMRVLFTEVYNLPGDLIKQLKWKNFTGSIQEFKDLQKKLKEGDDFNKFVKEFKDRDGQKRFARECCNGSLPVAISNVSVFLTARQLSRLRWKQFYGSVDNLIEIENLIFNQNGKLNEEFIENFKNTSGQTIIARDFFYGNMEVAYYNVSLLMEKSNFERMNWEIIKSSVDELDLLKEQLFNEDGSLQMKYALSEGYLLFCETWFPEKNMLLIYKQVSRFLGGNQFRQLEWQRFDGWIDEFNLLKNHLIERDGKINNLYQFLDGMARFAAHFFKGNMQKTYENARAVIPPALFNQLGWINFYGSTSEFNFLKSKIFTSKDDIVNKEFIEEYKEMDGLAQLSFLNQNQDMSVTARNVFSILQGGTPQDEDYASQLKWRVFYGSKSEFNRVKTIFLRPDGSLNPDILQNYNGREGMIRVQKRFKRGSRKIFKNISAILPPDVFDQLNWSLVSISPQKGTTKNNWIDLIFNADGSVNESFINDYYRMDGLSLFAKKFFEGNMLKAYNETSSLMRRFKPDFYRLKWRRFQGNIYEYEDLKLKALDSRDGSLRDEFINQFQEMEGYLNFSRLYSVSPSGLEEDKLYLYKNDMRKAYLNVSIVTSPNFSSMNWKLFDGSVDDFDKFMNDILISGELKKPEEMVINPEFEGMDQMARLSESYTRSNMNLLFTNASALLGGAENVINLLDWKTFKGYSHQFYNLIEDFEEHYPENWIDPEGQKRIADKIFNGNRKKLYNNVSAMRGYFFDKDRQKGNYGKLPQLIGNQKFNELNWERL